MKPDNKKDELEKLKNLADAETTLLKDLYGDLFGGGSKKPAKKTDQASKTPGQDTPQDGYLTTEEILKKAEEDAVKKARSALDEANELLKDEKAEQEAKKAEEAKKQEPEQDPMEQLEELIGLTTIKHDVKELADFARVQKLRKEAGLKSVPVSMHLVFTGNPGTGKTTVARILAKLYKNIGILSGGQLVEVDRSGLVAGYVGQTAIKTQEAIQKAMGGVLFIDEAYALARKDDTFGQEAIDTILKAMEDHRDELVVIVAGYTSPMEAFINSNPGLKSRFNKYIEFPDYTVDELEGIFDLNCRKYDYVVDEDAKKQIREMIKIRKLVKLENFANAREVRNMFEEFITNQARRVASIENPTHDDMIRITLEDLADKEDELKPEESETEKNVPAKEKAGEAETVPENPAETEQAPDEAGAEENIPEEQKADEADTETQETEDE